MRPTITQYYTQMLPLVASRGTCSRRQVAAIITDEKGHLIATGYNGVPSGEAHCIDKPCLGATDQPGNNRRCLAIHAETNALLQSGVRLATATRMYCSCTPCFDCCKLILCSSIQKVICLEEYSDKSGLCLLVRNRREVYRSDYGQWLKWHVYPGGDDGNWVIVADLVEP